MNLQPNFHDNNKRYLNTFSAGDDFYESLIEAHLGLSDAESAQMNARLILILANLVGDLPMLNEALKLAKKSKIS